MPNDYTDPVEIIIRNQVASGKIPKSSGSWSGLMEGIARSITAPFRFPSGKSLKKMVDRNKAESEYWYERKQPEYLPPGHPDRRK